MSTFKEIREDAEPHIGTLVLDGWEIVKLLGVKRESDDFYYQFVSHKNGKYSASCACGYTVLKGKIDDKDYCQILWQWNEHFKMIYEETKAI